MVNYCRLKNKVVIITGASRGLGRELALAFAEKEAKCVLCARSKDLEKVVNEISAKSGQAIGIQADISSEESASKLVEAAVLNYGGLDVWINNAGVLYSCSIEEIKGEKMEQIFEVNTLGTIYGSREALKYMKKQGSGQIINIISTAGKEGKPNEAAYVASKFAVTGFTESLRNEAFPYGIKISAIFPGGMKTSFFEKEKPEKDIRNFMDPKEIAQLIVYLTNLPENMLLKEIELKRM